MPESQTEYLDYYPPGWTEEIYEETYIEWIYDNDQTVLFVWMGRWATAIIQ